MLPLSYAIRNLFRTPSRLVQMVIGSALVVLLICFAAAFDTGMDRSLQATGDVKNVIVLGSGSEESIERSEVAANMAGILAANIPNLATTYGQPAVSGEVYYNGLVGIGSAGPEVQAILRGVTPAALAVHRSVRLVEGDFPGPDEMLVGVRAHEMLGVDAAATAVGKQLRFEGRDYTISGRFIAPRSVLEAEIWLDLADMQAVTKREGLSAVTLRLGPEGTFGDVDAFCFRNQARYEIDAVRETEYYGKLAAFFAPIKLMAWLTAILIAAGAVFGGLNTFYAAFVARMAELGTLQAIGFRRWMILLSLLQEGVLATACGTLVGLSIGLLAIDGMTVSFSSGVFTLTFTDAILFQGLVTGAALGVIGTLPPAWRCLSAELPKALRSA